VDNGQTTGVKMHLFSIESVFKGKNHDGTDLRTDRSLIVLWPIIFPQSALVFALTDDLGSYVDYQTMDHK